MKLISVILIMMIALAIKTAAAKVVRVVVEERVLLANGHFFGNAGQYEKIRGTIYYEVDPKNLGDVRLPDVDVPLGTYQGFNTRKIEANAPNYMTSFFGSFWPIIHQIIFNLVF